jgi:hypothetical protein
VPARRDVAAVEERTPEREEGRRVRPSSALLVALAYLGIGALGWSHAIAGGLGTSLPVGSIDPVQDVWYLAWALHFLEHGGNPLYTHAVYAPEGVNLLANNSILTLGILFSPVTALFGPVATFNVLAVVSPAAGAMAAWYAARQYVTWQPAAFVAGLCYGFGACVATSVRFGDYNLSFVALPPLILVLLDRLLMRQVGSPRRLGLAIGLLAVAQFFVSTEYEALTLLTALICFGLVALAHRGQVAAHIRRARDGIVTAAAVPAACLAYPLWLAVAGPRHITGPVWPNIPGLAATVMSSLGPDIELPGVAYLAHGNGAYLGATLVAMVIAAPLVWRRDRTIRLASAMTGILYLLSLGYTLHVTDADTRVPLPLWPLRYLPALDSVAASHFGWLVDLFAGGTLALVLDRLHAGDTGLLRLPAGWSARPRLRQLVPAGAGVLAVAPLFIASPWPYAVRQVVEPPALAGGPVAMAPAGTVLLEYPPIDTETDDAMLWQAVGGLHYVLRDGYMLTPAAGGGGAVFPPYDAVQLAFDAGQLGMLRAPPAPSAVAAIRAAAAADHAGEVVVLGGYIESQVVVEVMAAAFGPPAASFPDGSAVWTLVPGHE